MKHNKNNAGFTLIELAIASTLFAFVMIGVTQLFASALDIQRRAVGYQAIEENALFVLESIAREIRVSTIISENTDCTGVDSGTNTITVEHPVNGIVTYDYNPNLGVITRSVNGGFAGAITSENVNVTKFKFCVAGVGLDDKQVRVTIPISIQASSGKGDSVVLISLQTTVVLREFTADLSN